MTFLRLAKRAEKLTIDNSPVILTTFGVTGTLITAFLTGKATLRATELIAAEQARLDMHETSHPLDNKEKVKLVWKEFVPPAGVAVLTIVCIVGANRIGTRRVAAMATAFSLSERALSEYKDKVVEKLGEKKERDLRDEITQEHVNRNPPNPSEIIITGDGDVLCFDDFCGRYFYSSMETLKKAVNDTNYQVIHDGYASLTDFYNKIGLGRTGISDDVGWTTDKLLDITFTTCISVDQKPALAFSFTVGPAKDYHKFG